MTLAVLPVVPGRGALEREEERELPVHGRLAAAAVVRRALELVPEDLGAVADGDESRLREGEVVRNAVGILRVGLVVGVEAQHRVVLDHLQEPSVSCPGRLLVEFRDQRRIIPVLSAVLVRQGLVFRSLRNRRVGVQGAEQLQDSAFLRSTDESVLRLTDEADDTGPIRVLDVVRVRSNRLDWAKRHDTELADLEVVGRAVALPVAKADVQFLALPEVEALVVGFADRGEVRFRQLRDRIVCYPGLAEDLVVLAPAAREHAVRRRRRRRRRDIVDVWRLRLCGAGVHDRDGVLRGVAVVGRVPGGQLHGHRVHVHDAQPGLLRRRAHVRRAQDFEGELRLRNHALVGAVPTSFIRVQTDKDGPDMHRADPLNEFRRAVAGVDAPRVHVVGTIAHFN
jgi:hypothetical protein